MTSKPMAPSRARFTTRPMSWTLAAVRSLGAAVIAILNLRGRNENSGCNVDHWRMASAQTRGSSISSAVAPANGSAVTLRMQLPLVWMACMSTLARCSRISGVSASLIQWNCRFWRVVKWP